MANELTQNKKKVTIKDVAKEAGVSISVVSYVLNHSKNVSISEATKKKVFDAANKLDYVPNRFASGMRTKRSKCIGIVAYWEIEGGIFAKMLNGISTAAEENGYRIVLCSRHDTAEKYDYLDYFYDMTVDGIVFIAPYEEFGLIDEQEHIHKMQEAKIPFTVINGHTSLPGVSYVNIDFYGSAKLATKYLIRKGFREVTYVTPDLQYNELKERYRGYHDAMQQANLKESVCNVKNVPNRIGEFRAVVANKSDTAQIVLKEAWKQKIDVPQQFSIIACNTMPFSEYLFPSLSTVKVPGFEMGSMAARFVMDQIEGRAGSDIESPECSLMIRDSSI